MTGFVEYIQEKGVCSFANLHEVCYIYMCSKAVNADRSI